MRDITALLGCCARNMTSMNLSLPEPLKLFVEEQVSKGGYSTASEYLAELTREAQRRADQPELEAMLLAGLQIPTSEMTSEEWSVLRNRILSRSPDRLARTRLARECAKLDASAERELADGGQARDASEWPEY
jgi:antitoxin ParD1/3/4